MSDYKELKAKTFGYSDLVRQELQNYFPEYYFVYESEPVQGWQKYTWTSYIVIEYFNQLYRIDMESSGNGGWLDIDDYKVTDIKKCKKVERVVYDFV